MGKTASKGVNILVFIRYTETISTTFNIFPFSEKKVDKNGKAKKKGRVTAYLSEEEIEIVEALAEKVNISRNKIIQQITRKYFGLPSMLHDAKFYEKKEAEE